MTYTFVGYALFLCLKMHSGESGQSPLESERSRMVEVKLPESFINAIRKHGIDKNDVIFAATGDLDEEQRFADTVVALTKEKLIIAKYPYMEKQEYRLGGYNSWSLEQEKRMEEPAVVLHDLAVVEKLEVIRQVSTGILMGRIGGIDRYLCQFSNTRMEAFMRLGRLLEKMKKEEEITKEDLDIKYKLRLAVMIFCYLATAGLNLVWPYLSGTVLYDKVLEKDEGFLAMFHLPAGRFTLALGVLVIVMVGTKVLLQGLGILQGVLTAHIAPEVVAKLILCWHWLL